MRKFQGNGSLVYCFIHPFPPTQTTEKISSHSVYQNMWELYKHVPACYTPHRNLTRSSKDRFLFCLFVSPKAPRLLIVNCRQTPSTPISLCSQDDRPNICQKNKQTIQGSKATRKFDSNSLLQSLPFPETHTSFFWLKRTQRLWSGLTVTDQPQR